MAPNLVASMNASGSPKKKRPDTLLIGTKIFIKPSAIEISVSHEDVGQIGIIEGVNMPCCIPHYIVYVPSSACTWSLRPKDIKPPPLNLEAMFNDSD